MEFKDIFSRYEAIVAEVDDAFNKVAAQAENGVNCKKGCSDCCHALFDLTLVEALYLNHKFNEKYSGLERSQMLERADSADRQIHKIKRNAFKASQAGKSASEILKEVSLARVRCPLLGEQDSCDLYEFRPLTCRIYGTPMNIGGQGHCCGKSGFDKGKQYPAMNMDLLQNKLFDLSKEIADSINSSYKELEQMLIPASMAMLTDFTMEYLGARVGKTPEPEPEQSTDEAPAKACATCSEDKSSCADCSYSVSLGQAPKAD